MENKKFVISKGNIKIKNSDGTSRDIDFIMPEEVSMEIISDIIEWKSKWLMTPVDYEKYQQDKHEYMKELEKEYNEVI